MSDRELTLTKIINAPRRSVWRCWTEAALLRQWFAPRPWTTPRAELDVRPGSASLAVLTFEAQCADQLQEVAGRLA